MHEMVRPGQRCPAFRSGKIKNWPFANIKRRVWPGCYPTIPVE